MKKYATERHLNYSKANWQKFKEYLELTDTKAILNNKNSNEINDFLITALKEAAKKAIPLKSNTLKK
jgi:hypothetical protein